MKKVDAIAIFRTVTNMAKSLEMTRQGIYNMPDELNQAQEDRVVGACYRLGMEMPPRQAQIHEGG